MKNPLKASLVFFALLSSLISSKTILAEETSSQLSVALMGYDVVAYQAKNKAVKGSASNTAYHKGLTYLFKSKDNADLFKKTPDKYLPAYGGYCALDVTSGKKTVSNPRNFKVVDGRLYLLANKSAQKKWQEDIKGNITKANKIWPTLHSAQSDKS
jgi:hypothetical protein